MAAIVKPACGINVNVISLQPDKTEILASAKNQTPRSHGKMPAGTPIAFHTAMAPVAMVHSNHN